MANTAVRDSKKPSSIYRYGYPSRIKKFEENTRNTKKYKNLLNVKFSN